MQDNTSPLANDEMSENESVENQDLSSRSAEIEPESHVCAGCSATKQEAEEYKRSWQRALADYTNLQKETAARRLEWAEMSSRQILEEFIPIYDNFKKAFFHQPELPQEDDTSRKIKNWMDGIGHIQRQFNEVLRQNKVQEIPTVGTLFDPSLHESVAEEEASGQEHGVIVREIDGGYKLGERVIRVAKVVIAK